MIGMTLMGMNKLTTVDGVEDVESGLADAFEGDESNYWNID